MKTKQHKEKPHLKMYTTRMPVPILDLAKRINKHSGMSVSKVMREGIELVAKREGVK